jgi:cob(I)alamin adenosyltransferase
LKNKNKMKNSLGLIHIYTGDGKGKTSAAIGLAVRATGAGLSVLFAQLFKKNSYEIRQLEKTGVTYCQYYCQHPFFKKYSADELEKQAYSCNSFVNDMFSKAKKEKYDVLILDEIGPALNSELISSDKLAKLIKSKPRNLELVMTGRGFSKQIIELADYVTEMKMIKHPFTKGITARKGIEY